MGTNQDLWVAGQRHNEREPSELVEMFKTMRQFNLALWKQMSSGDLKRTRRVSMSLRPVGMEFSEYFHLS